jgi:hypothetical protein
MYKFRASAGDALKMAELSWRPASVVTVDMFEVPGVV